MRSVSQKWGALNATKTREPRYYFRIQPNPGTAADDLYVVSHADITISAAGTVVTAARLSDIKVASQQLNPDEGRATIGSMSFGVQDNQASMTAVQRVEYLTNSRGFRNKPCSLYSGFRQISDTDYELEDTQVVESVQYRAGVYTFFCRDKQRSLRKQLFEPVVLNLAAPLDATSTTIEVYSTTGLVAVEHGASYSDAPSATVAYVKIDDEIIRVPTAGIGSTQLTGVTRGVLGTRAAEHTTDESKGSERGKKVTEVIYLEMSVPKLAYALLTGVLLNQSATLPDHWHLGMDPSDDVAASDFQNIGSDLIVVSDDTLGAKERYILTDAEDGKTFIERQLLRKYGLFMPVHATGELGLKRGQSVLSGAAVVGEINDSHIIGPVSLRYDMTKVVNDILIGWNEINGEPSRFLQIVDQDSVDIWGLAPQLEVTAKGLTGSIHTSSIVRDLYEGLRDRYSGPPLITSVTCQRSQNLYEVGDVIRLRTSFVRDFTNSLTTYIDRAFEIQGVSKDLEHGRVRYELFGSSQRAGNLPPIESGNALTDGFYTATGTDIAGLSGVVDAGSELQLPNGLDLPGASTVTGAVYYATKDVRIPSGNTVTYNDNVQLRIRGVLQIDGELSGAGRGLAGVADTVSAVGGTDIPYPFTPDEPVDFAFQAGQPGYLGSTQADGGIIERVRNQETSPAKFSTEIQSIPGTITQGEVEAIPSLNLKVVSNAIEGIPSDLRGTSGGPGGLRYWMNTRPSPDVEELNRGGTGGAGGAGLLIICRGMVFGASGRIDSSGADGSVGVINLSDQRPAWSGSGAGGAPGATVILLDGSSVSSPALTAGSIIADYGASPDPGSEFNVLQDAWVSQRGVKIGAGESIPDRRYSFFRSAASGREVGIGAARFFFLLPETTPEEDTEDVVLAGDQDISLAITEAFEARVDPAVTTLIATITENTTTQSYSHANIYVKGLDSGSLYYNVWTFVGPAEPTLQFELPADNKNYGIKAVPVLINGAEAAAGVEQTQVVSSPGLGVSFDDSSALQFNGAFDDWPAASDRPTGWGSWTNGVSPNITREDTLVLTGKYACRWATDGAANYGINRSLAVNSPTIAVTLPLDTVLQFEGWLYIEAINTANGGQPGFIVDLAQGANYIRKFVPADVSITGQWQRLSCKLSMQDYDSSSGVGSITAFTNVRVYQIAAYKSANFGGDYFDGDVIFDKVRFQFISPGIENVRTTWAQISANGGGTIPADNATVGGTLGVDVKAEDGSTILGNIDVRNDLLVTKQLGAFNANPGFQYPRPSLTGSGIAPASWWRGNSTTGDLSYVSATARDELLIANGYTAVNAAFPVNPDTTYTITALVRAVTGTVDVDLRVEEYNTALLATGKRAIGNGGPTTEVQTRDALQTLVNDQSVGTTYELVTATYTPGASAQWASVSLWGNSTGAMRVEWAVVRDNATRNTGALADQDTVGTGDFDSGAVDTTDVASSAITAAVQSNTTSTYNFSAASAWETIMSQAITPASGESVMVNATFEVQNPDISGIKLFRVRLLRDSTTLWTQSGTYDNVSTLRSKVLSLAYLDSPSSGSHTYKVDVITDDAALEIEYRTLLLTRLKR